MDPQPLSTQTLTVTAPARPWACDARTTPGPRVVLVVACRDEADLVELGPDRPVVFGRRPPCEVVVDDPAVSRQHARVSLQGDRVTVEDLDSRNGTFVGEERVATRVVESGESIRVGPATIAYFASARPRSQTPDTDLVVVDPAMKELWATIDRVAQRDVPVLIVGESGTGKEHVARALHDRGPRSAGPFVALSCAAIVDALAESTLFGHERGAFTGATSKAVGAFEQAHGGTLLLDEIGEMAPAIQAKVLRVLETSLLTRVGGTQEIPIDVRVVGATHRPVAPEAADTVMRPDLYYRLSTVVLSVPPLRERRAEIVPLAEHFLARARAEWQTGPAEFEPAALSALEQHDWPGNVRELRHVIQRAVLLCDRTRIGPDDLPSVLRTGADVDTPGAESGTTLGERMLRHERAILTEVLARHDGNRAAAAATLGMPRRTFFRKLRQHGLTSR